MKKCLIVLLGFLITACSGSDLGSRCSTEEACANDPKCQCWCSEKCGFRNKKSGDSPVYIQDDPNGKRCYCKQWDLDHFEENCIEGKNIPQPTNVQLEN